MDEKDRIFLSTVQKQPFLRDQVYEILAQAIKENRLKPGERLVESKLAEELGISRGPIREAIARLVAEGLLVGGGSNGVRVAPLPSLPEIAENYVIRAVLQGMAARLAAEKIDDSELQDLKLCLDKAKRSLAKGDIEGFLDHNLQFHELIEKASRSAKLQEVINYLRSPLYKRVSHKLSQILRIDVALKEHEEILKAIEGRDGERAERLMRAHVENAKESLLKRFKEEV